MFEQFSGIFQKKSQDTLSIAYAEVPAWLDGHEKHISADLAEPAKRHVDEVSLVIERLQQTLKTLQEHEKTAGPDEQSPDLVKNSLSPFIQQISGPLSADLPLDICRFFTEAETIFGSCNEAVAEHGQDLMSAFPDEISAMREDSHALGRALLAARVPIIEKCRAQRQRIGKVRDILAKIALAEQDSAGSAERITWIHGQVDENSEDIERIKAECQELESDPEPFLRQQMEASERLKAKKEEIRQAYISRADIVSALMLYARTIANEKNDTYGSEVLLDLIQLLTGKDVPKEDILMPALACAFEIILDMIENGNLVPGNDEAAEVLKKPAEYNKDLCGICRDYADVESRIGMILIGPDAVAQRKQQMNDEIERIQAQIRDYQTAEQDLSTRRMLAAREQWSMKKPLEDAISELTGSVVQIRLNGEAFPRQKQAGPTGHAGG